MKPARFLTLAILISLSAVPVHANPVRIEAEDMTLDTYRVENVATASNGRVINLKGPGVMGSAESVFAGPGGNYDVFIAYHDESDGIAQLTVEISGENIATLNLDEASGDAQPTERNLRIRQIASDRNVGANSTIRIVALQGRWDNANVDYIEFVPASAAQPSAAAFAVVASEGGDYTNPLDAVDNLSSGDRWCREDPSYSNPCQIQIRPGAYDLDQTLVLPHAVSVVGAGSESTTLVGAMDNGIAILLQNDARSSIRDLSIDHTNNPSILASGVRVGIGSTAILQNIDIAVAGSTVNLALDARADESSIEVSGSRIRANTGDEATGIVGAFLEVRDSEISVSGGASSTAISLRTDDNIGGRLTVERATIRAIGQLGSVGIAAASSESTVRIADSQITVEGGTSSNTGLSMGGVGTRTTLHDLDINVRGRSGASANGINYFGTASGTEARIEGVRVLATDGAAASALRIVELNELLDVVNSELTAENASGNAAGIRLLRGDSPVRVQGSRLRGENAAISVDDQSGFASFSFSFSRLDGTFLLPNSNAPTISCGAVTDENNVFYPDTCPP